tara:strand:+ start:28 stop:369 length:342 start_codon:yes stop_codon:yes gene_type:complete
MARDRYETKRTILNNNSIYKEILQARNVPFIEHYRFRSMRYPTVQQLGQLQINKHIWSLGDKYWKLAEAAYGDPSLWWVLAWFNKKPTESHFKMGDMVLIPYPLETVLDLLGV